VGINHLEAHIYANWLRAENSETLRSSTPEDIGDGWPGDPEFPLLALVISGAHTELVHITHHGHYRLLGQTRDDAAGEAFDKVARLLGLGYPGGPAIEQAAALAGVQPSGGRNPYRLPRAWIPGTYDFSFSGLKTAVLQFIEGARNGGGPEETAPASRYARRAALQGDLSIPRVAAAFQEAVVDVLSTKTVRAAQALQVKEVVLAGGVAANLALRARLSEALSPHHIPLRFPPVSLCTDNAAMIAAAGYFHRRIGEVSGHDLDVRPGLQLPFAERP
jgi:N6-L-threonylcarbamoyladenine synthase